MDKLPNIWVGVELFDHINEKNTYYHCQYNQLPKIQIGKSFYRIATLKDIEKNAKDLNEEITSPYGCYFEVDYKTGTFYQDKQNEGISWRIDKQYNVYVVANKMNENKVEGVVAKSIPEFLTRMKIESVIWHKLNGYGRNGLTEFEKGYLKHLKENTKEEEIEGKK